jgi:hypothetical protein
LYGVPKSDCCDLFSIEGVLTDYIKLFMFTFVRHEIVIVSDQSEEEEDREEVPPKDDSSSKRVSGMYGDVPT